MSQFWFEFIPSPRWVRAQVGNTYVGDSKRMMLLRQTGVLPTYYFPRADVRTDLLTAGPSNSDKQHGKRQFWTMTVDGQKRERAAWSYLDSAELSDYIAFKWESIDAWYEEDDQIYRHARDPYKRIDANASSRHIEVVIGGEKVADTRRAYLLFETDLPTRYYIPRQDVRFDLLVHSDTKTQCPYKGISSYYSVKAGGKLYKDIAWYYPFPIPECPKIENLICFFNERVDAIFVNGEQEEKAVTPWSR